jgi:hypothetical protein
LTYAASFLAATDCALHAAGCFLDAAFGTNTSAASGAAGDILGAAFGDIGCSSGAIAGTSFHEGIRLRVMFA